MPSIIHNYIHIYSSPIPNADVWMESVYDISSD